jgi:asparagine synthase (glutamine-hydrolysing)
MCGLVALFRSDDRPVAAAEVAAMRDLLVHRGPDDDGLYVDGPVGLGFRRLQIIDLAGGHQPMADASGTLQLVFNGEIYNYRGLRRLLLSRGIALRTQSDTETILGLYQLFGLRCVEYLHGMFAFVLWDGARRRLVAARDRLGIKPLYLLRQDGGIALASEIKAFQGLRGWAPRLAAEGLPEYLIYRGLAGNRTLLAGVERVAPGELLVFGEGQERRERYWSFPVPDAPATPAATPRAQREWEEELHDLLSEVVREHLVSDVPLGTFNSGGVDSSLVTALASYGRANPLNTYAVGFADPAFDESAYAQMVAERYRTHHHRLAIDGEEFAAWLGRAIWHHDEPLSHPHCVPLLRLAMLAKQKVTVVLTGEGSDELFGGYRRYRLPALLDRLPLPRWGLRLAVAAAAPRLGELERLRARAMLRDRRGARVEGLAAFVAPEQVRGLLAPQVLAAMAGGGEAGAAADLAARDGLSPVRRPGVLAQTLWFDQQTYLQALLNRLDKMMMAASVEGRVPFLDHRVVELAARLPAGLKVHGTTTKYLLKRVAERYLPPTITRRRKAGFAVPLADWLRAGGPLAPAAALLLEPRTLERGLLVPERVRALVAEHRDGRRDHHEILWALLNLELWHRVWLEREAGAETGLEAPERPAGGRPGEVAAGAGGPLAGGASAGGGNGGGPSAGEPSASEPGAAGVQAGG